MARTRFLAGFFSSGFPEVSAVYVEKKWQVNREKVAWAKSFPGLLRAPSDAIGLTLRKVIPLEKEPYFILLFDEGRILLTPAPAEILPPEILEALQRARTDIEPFHREFFRELDRLAGEDREMQRLARLENIVGAIRNNARTIPELKDTLRVLLSELEGEEPGPCRLRVRLSSRRAPSL